MGKKKITQHAGVPVVRPQSGQLDTSAHPARWALHETSVPINIAIRETDGIDSALSRVKATLGDMGTPALHPLFMEALDRGHLRPQFKDWLDRRGVGTAWEREVTAYLPLTTGEGLALLRRHHPKLHHAITRAKPVGDLTNMEAGLECDPVVGESLIRYRRQQASAFLARYVGRA